MTLICDNCKIDVNEVFILRHNHFTKKGKHNKKDKLERVCYRCGQNLARTRLYDFGTYWKGILLTYPMVIK